MVALHLALLAAALGNPGETVLLDFTATWCAPCRQMDPIVRQLQAQGFPIQQVDVDQQPQLAQQFRVTGVPCFVLVSGGREVSRMEGATDAQSLIGMFQAANPAGGGLARGQSPDPAPTAAPPLFGAPADVPATAPVAFGAPAGVADAPRTAVGASDPALAAAIDPAVLSAMMNASVRIRIGDGSGNSVGSGTIIDTRDGEALVLTCGHIFRDSQGRGNILIDMFGPGARQGIAATMIGYDLESDVGLISFRPGVNVQSCPVAADAGSVQVGDVVVSIGCNHGAEPTSRVSKVTSIDKFLGPANLQVAGQPVQGRSGGGLFDTQGRLVGVCNAADPEDNEGLYAALKSVHAQFEKLDLAELLLAQGPAANPSPAVSAPPVAAASAEVPPLAAAPPAMPRSMPEPGAPPAAVIPAAFNAPIANDDRGLSAGEAAMLDELRKRAGDAEIICIVRSLTDPQAKSEIIVLDRASPEFIRQLATLRTVGIRQETGLRMQ